MVDLKKIIMVYVFGFGLLTTPFVYADNTGMPPADHSSPQGWHARMEKRTQEMYSQLNLTVEQKAKLEANKQKHKEQMQTLFGQMKSSREALKQELMKTNLDMTKINQIHAQFKALQAQMADDHLNSILEVRKILTPEQFTKFISSMEKRKHAHPPATPGEK